ncbi:MAG: glycoside hydrolase family 65 protein [Chloroflexi bacterium HGW-Chloroflexi-3]|nr:MAG: glycoside hydrolase family 65 protein [Chloroflexi bacterium HGW-Chloroflexi-3]
MWIITEKTFDPISQHHKETIFTIGNGYLSTRGTLEEGYPGEHRATFVHGVFDDVPVVFTELANAPDWLLLTVLINGERFSLKSGKVLDYQRELNLRTGLLTRHVCWQSPSGHISTLKFERFASLHNQHLLALRCQVTPEFNGEVEIRTALNGNTDNEGFTHWDWVEQNRENQDTLYLINRTRKTGIKLALAIRLLGIDSLQPDYWDVENVPTFRQVFQAGCGETVTITKFVGIATSRDAEVPQALAIEAITKSQNWDIALKENEQAWEQEWERCEVSIEGDDEAQIAIRFNLFQLLIAAPRHDYRVNIGAKTLSGFGYRGHAFWDTEIFMLPVFTYTAPHIARNLLDYRYLTLPAARQKAHQAGYEGAFYAWESAATGEEVTPTWVPDFHDRKKLTRVWTGDLAIHISADIAYGIWQYWLATGDDNWLAERGIEIMLETAKFYVSRAEWQADKDIYTYCDVIGPDEYHDHVNNNTYTNRLAQWNILTALQILDWLREKYPQKTTKLTQQLNLTPELLANWRKVAEKILLNKHPNGLFEQFDGFFALKDVNLADYEPRSKSMHEIFGIEAANHYQAIKQPDVLMLQYLLREEYNDQEIRVNYDYYTPRTDHSYGSSLGPSIQSVVASMMGEVDVAYEHFILAARADLRDIRGNAGDGIHAASAGGTWQALVFGFGGLKVGSHGWSTHARLPQHWKSLSFRFFYRGQLQKVVIKPEDLR